MMIKTKTASLVTIIMIFAFSIAEAKLAAHPEQFQIKVIKGEIETIQLHLTNLGPSSKLNYEASTTEEWLSFKTAEGEVRVNDTIDLDIIIDATSLDVGVYEATLIVGDPHHGPIVIPIEVVVNKTADIEELEVESSSFGINVYSIPGTSTITLNYNVTGVENVLINLYDINGNFVKTIVNEPQGHGQHQKIINGSGLSSGVYFIAIKINHIFVIKKLIFSI